ncbi:MAG: DEAD/DEAH box helicase, partial [Breznakibacter sp.]|nr:DEAD/DEAH box helicase [Breznakibacter sp.]
MSDLSTQNIMYLPGVGPKRAELMMKELKISSFEDLIYYFPFKHIDRSRIYRINEININLPYIQIKGRFTSLQTMGQARQTRLVATFSDGTGFIELIWFKSIKQIKESIDANAEYLIFGKPSHFNGVINIVHPEMEKLKDGKSMLPGNLQAFYNTTEKMKSNFLNSKAIQKMMISVFAAFQGKIPESLPAALLSQLPIINRHEALHAIHFPQDTQQLEKARFRLKFEELFYIQLNILRLRNQRTAHVHGHHFGIVGEHLNHFYANHLPFELTNAQKRVIKEIRKDMGSGKQMNRLLQGDVGSGKTLVALMVMLIALDNHYQACLMAPTEILANQHFESLTTLLKDMPVKMGLLTGSTKKKERTILHEQLRSGELQILIGTHALLEDTVQFNNLGLVVIDEQHRFGVAQRARLWKKNTTPPHILVMTATPIPRTLAMTVYGDLDV